MRAAPSLTFFCDDARHLVCTPYSVENLHCMARALNIRPCWFHRPAGGYAHYDIPKRRIAEVQSKCRVVGSRTVLAIVKGTFKT